jgi:hypothetical protein
MGDVFIRDPASGIGAAVRGSGGNAHLLTEAIDIDFIAHNSREDELSFVWVSTTYDYDAADTILLVQNTDSDRDLYLHKATWHGDAASTITFHTTDGTALTPAGTAITGINLNRKSGKVALATAIRDETNNTQGNVIGSFKVEANKWDDWDFDDTIILGNGQSVAADIVTNGAAAVVAFYGFYQEI